MNKEYYSVLGVEPNATDEEIKNRYETLKAKYSEERWLDGEAGNEAAKMLTKIETAYAEILAERSEKNETEEDVGKKYEEIAEMLKNGNLTDAQNKLDSFNERGAEWHYLQAVVFYKKNWTSESKKQLEIAMQIDPDNAKYRNAYQKLNAKNNYTEQNGQYTQSENPYKENNEEQMGGNACSECISCCYTYLCINCLFQCCCGCR